ncbi:MAG: SCO family protein [Chitinophagaceae bacterium]|nr:MAG: SCO family protein [Chitinophagaceae bacterium]
MIPLTGYFIVKYYSKNAVNMPRHYFYDEVATTERRGETVPDTIWHQVKNIEFANQLGKKVSLQDARGKVIVLNFFFTRCPSICPGLTRNMKRLQDAFAKNPDIVQFISFSVDPEHDSIPVLRKYADKFGVNHDNWWLATGNKKEIYDFAFQEIKANIADVNVDTAFVHTENFFLLDSNRVVRGWYNGFDTAKLAQLASDIPTLMLEKNRKSPSILRNFIPVLPLIFIGIAVVILITTFLSKKRQKF